MADVFRTIYEIDKERNGFVTSTELDDILNLFYEQELATMNLKPMLKPYCSSANKVLLDYKKFREFIFKGLEGSFRDDKDIKVNKNILNL